MAPWHQLVPIPLTSLLLAENKALQSNTRCWARRWCCVGRGSGSTAVATSSVLLLCALEVPDIF